MERRIGATDTLAERGLAISPSTSRTLRPSSQTSRDRTARVFSLATGDLEASYLGHEAPVSGVAFSPDGRTVYSCGRDKDVHFWATKDAKRGGKLAGAEGELFRVLLVADQVFSGGADTRVRQHKVDDRTLVRALAGHGDRIYALAAHAPGKRLATGAHNGEVRVWNWETGAGMASFIAVPK